MQNSAQLSVEEILESIKKVIARDNSKLAQAERHRRETIGVVFSDGALKEASRRIERAPVAENDEFDDEIELETGDELGDEVLELAQMLADEDGDETAEEELTDSPAAPPLSETAQQQVRRSLEALAAFANAAPAQPAAEEEAPLERMVRETLRPMLAEWIDANLPDIVEKLVRVEIERISGKPR